MRLGVCVCDWLCVGVYLSACECVCVYGCVCVGVHFQVGGGVCVRLSERECVRAFVGERVCVWRVRQYQECSKKKVNFRSNENRSIKVVALQKPYQLKVENIVD